MSKTGQTRLLVERPLECEAEHRGRRANRPARSVTVNLAESPLGWLLARGLVTQRQSMRASGCGPIGNGRSCRRE